MDLCNNLNNTFEKFNSNRFCLPTCLKPSLPHKMPLVNYSKLTCQKRTRYHSYFS